jgi:hypothetical protein
MCLCNASAQLGAVALQQHYAGRGSTPYSATLRSAGAVRGQGAAVLHAVSGQRSLTGV